jgi:HEAT repeat protein
VTHYKGALEEISKRLPSWEGQLNYSRKIQTLIELAYNSSELDIRTAALEITLVSNRIDRDPATVRAYSDLLKSDPNNKPWRLWILALLANRGIEMESTKRLLLEYIRDPNIETRKWAVDSLSMLGTDDIIEPLLTAFGTDPSAEVRERAGCSLAESGMFTREQRKKAIPGLLRLMDDPALDHTTQTWVFQALREISGQDLGENRAAWRDWAAKPGPDAR